MPSKRPRHPLPPRLFVYGQLRHGRRGASELDAFHRVSAVAVGQLVEVGDDLYATFGDRDPGAPIAGELVEIGVAALPQVLGRLDEIEGEWFRQRVIDVRQEDGTVREALVYEWWRTASSGQLLAAALRKIEIAAYHLSTLRGLDELTGPGPEPRATVAAQAAFEGVLVSFDAAVDQVTHALRDWPAVQWIGGVRPGDSFEDAIAFHERRRPNAPGVRELKVWGAASIVNDVRRVRNLAVHSAYSKSGRFSRGMKALIVQPIAGVPVQGAEADRSVGAYAQRAVDHLLRLEPVIEKLQQGLQSRSTNRRRES